MIYDIKENIFIQKSFVEEFDKLKDTTEDEIWDMFTEVKKADERSARKRW